ncbi:MAG: hypothetical protein EB018_10755, partial [Gammaproteobacteria bacterium]|nr:hypothetical protein [Gammaproteobacteria bacterium]
MIDDELQALVLIGLNPAIRADLRAERRAAVLVEHLHAHVAGRGVAERKELTLDRGHVGEIAHRLALGDGLGEPHARDGLSHRAHGDDVRHALVIVGRVGAGGEFAREAALAVSWKVEVEIEWCTELQVAEVGARSTVALHEVPVDLAGGAAVLPHAVEEWAVELGVAKDQALLWCAMREVALARLLEANPWISRAITDGLAACAASLHVDSGAIEEAMHGIDLTNLSSMPDLWTSGAMDARPSAAGQAAAARVETLVTLMESWADSVIGAAAAGRLPAHVAMCEAYHRRRQSASATKELLDSLLGVDVSGRRLRVAQGLWDYIASKHTVQARDRLWSHPDLL